MKSRLAFARRRRTGVKAGVIRLGLVAGLVAVVAGLAAPAVGPAAVAEGGGIFGTGCCIGQA